MLVYLLRFPFPLHFFYSCSLSRWKAATTPIPSLFSSFLCPRLVLNYLTRGSEWTPLLPFRSSSWCTSVSGCRAESRDSRSSRCDACYEMERLIRIIIIIIIVFVKTNPLACGCRTSLVPRF